MCCLFNYCACVIDFIQRAWVCVMTCVISSAICMMLVVAAMSGITLGYDYSLSQYMDAKATNMSFRRQVGHEGVQSFANDSNLTTAVPDDDTLRSGRLLEDYRRNSNMFDPYLSTKVTPDEEDAKIYRTPYPKDNLLLPELPRLSPEQARPMQLPVPQGPDVAPDAAVAGVVDESGRMRYPARYLPPEINPAHFAVPDQSVQFLPPKDSALRGLLENTGFPVAKPIRYNEDSPIIPTRSTEGFIATKEPSTAEVSRTLSFEKINRSKNKLISEKYNEQKRVGNKHLIYQDADGPVRQRQGTAVKGKVASAVTHPNEIDNLPEKSKKDGGTSSTVLVNRLFSSFPQMDSHPNELEDIPKLANTMVELFRVL